MICEEAHVLVAAAAGRVHARKCLGPDDAVLVVRELCEVDEVLDVDLRRRQVDELDGGSLQQRRWTVLPISGLDPSVEHRIECELMSVHPNSVETASSLRYK